MLWSNMVYCVKLSGGDVSRYSNKIESVGLRKCPSYQLPPVASCKRGLTVIALPGPAHFTLTYPSLMPPLLTSKVKTATNVNEVQNVTLKCGGPGP